MGRNISTVVRVASLVEECGFAIGHIVDLAEMLYFEKYWVLVINIALLLQVVFT